MCLKEEEQDGRHRQEIECGAPAFTRLVQEEGVNDAPMCYGKP